MKHTKLFGSLVALAMALMTSVDTMAQEFAFKNVTFLTPGKTAKIAVALNSPEDARVIQGKIILPSGLTFVPTEEREDRFVISPTERSSKFNFYLQKSNDHVAAFVGAAKVFGNTIPSGNGDVFTFDVNVAADYAGPGKLTLTNGEINLKNGDIKNPEKDATGNVAKETDKLVASAVNVDFKADKETTIGISLDNTATPLTFLAFDIVLPQGVSVVEGSQEVTSRCPNHGIGYMKNRMTIFATGAGDSKFIDSNGDVCTFKITTDESFVDGSKITIKNIYGVNPSYVNYFAEDFEITLSATTGIGGISADKFAEAADGIYQLNGVRTDKLQRGVNIVVKDGKAVKVVKK